MAGDSSPCIKIGRVVAGQMMHKPAQVGLARLSDELVLVPQEYITVNHYVKLPLRLQEVLLELLIIRGAQEDPPFLTSFPRDIVKGAWILDSQRSGHDPPLYRFAFERI